MTPFGIYCISSGRPTNVPGVEKTFAPHAVTWIVPEGQAQDYRATGARYVCSVSATSGRKPLAAQRNHALDHAQDEGLMCVQTDDDVKRLQILQDWKATPAQPSAYLDAWEASLRTVKANLAGCAPTPNAYFGKHKISNLFVMGQLFATLPCDIRFDEELAVREDYDFTCRHLERYGSVARCDWLLPTYTHWTNRGGCQEYRNTELDESVNRTLLDRWPQYLSPHPRRAGELMLKVRK